MRPDSSATGMNSSGRDLPEHGVVPARQRLETLHRSVLQVDERLEGELQRPGLNGLAQAVFDGEALQRLAKNMGAVNFECAGPLGALTAAWAWRSRFSASPSASWARAQPTATSTLMR